VLRTLAAARDWASGGAALAYHRASLWAGRAYQYRGFYKEKRFVSPLLLAQLRARSRPAARAHLASWFRTRAESRFFLPA